MTPPWWLTVRSAVSFYGPTFHRMPDATNVLRHVTPGDAAFLLIHGEKDKTVPIENSRAFRDALVKLGELAPADIAWVQQLVEEGLVVDGDDTLDPMIEAGLENAGSSSEAAVVHLSQASREAQLAEKIIETAPETRGARVAAIKARIASGDYEIDHGKIASKMIEQDLEDLF